MSTVQLEEYDESLRGHKICAYLPYLADARTMTNFVRLVMSNIQVGGEPFTRIACVSADPVNRMLADSLGANMIMSAKEGPDWSLLLTAATQTGAGTFIVVFSDIRVPDVFLQRLPAGVTLLMFRLLEDAQPIPRHCNTYMFPLVKELNTAEHDYVLKKTSGLALRDDLTPILKELRVAHAGLLITLGGPARHDIYWWNTAEVVPGLRRKPEIAAAILHFIADSLTSA
jgi:hypothetical protein